MKRSTYVVYFHDHELYRFTATEPPPDIFQGNLRVDLHRARGTATRNLPNFDGTYNSVVAAIHYQSVRENRTLLMLQRLIEHNGAWFDKDTLMGWAGSEATRRVRELREDGGWPIETRTNAGQLNRWLYRMNLDPRLLP